MEAAGGVTLSFIDLPGHERFIKNMLAGVSGIDLVLFVIAADESVKPQTREHFEICRLLGIARGLIAITKCDLVGADALVAVRNEAKELTAGSFLADAPVVAVSAKTGAGLDQIRAKFVEAAARLGQREASGYFRLPVDRAFSIKGFGTVVTGTIISGRVRREAELELYPTGRRLRVRGLQVHGSAVETAETGQRAALNLAGIEAAEIERGMVLAERSRFRPARQLDCALELLPCVKLKPRANVHFHFGAAEIQAEIRRFSPARIVLREPALILPGDRFIIRASSPLTTIGGGTVLAIDAPKKPQPMQTVADVIARTGKLEAEVCMPPPGVVFVEPDLLVDLAWMDDQRAQLEEEVARFHRENPLRAGIPKESLRYQPLDYMLRTSSVLAVEEGFVRRRDHKIVVPNEDRDAIERAIRNGSLAAPAIADVLQGKADGRAILQSMLKEGTLVRVSADFVFHREAIAELKALLALRKGEIFTVSQFKDWVNISRKHAIPLLEFLDRAHVTRRTGDTRVVL